MWKSFSVPLIALLAALFLVGCSKTSSQAAKKTVNDFYQTVLQSHPDGDLSLAQLLRVRNYLSINRFNQVKDLAIAEEALARHEDDYPPLVEGNPFSGNPQGFRQFRIINCELAFSSGTCRIELQMGQQIWVDEAVLGQDPRGWTIEDIRFAGGGAPMRSGTLSDMITTIFKRYPKLSDK